MSQYVRKINLQHPNLRGAKDINHLAEMMEDHLRKITRSIQDEFTNVERAGGIAQQQTAQSITNVSSGSSGSSGTSIVITDYMRTGTASVTSAGTAIAFSSDMGIIPSIFQFRCYDADGNTIGCAISSLTSAGFTATSLENATLEYVATKVI